MNLATRKDDHAVEGIIDEVRVECLTEPNSPSLSPEGDSRGLTTASHKPGSVNYGISRGFIFSGYGICNA
jgi:hypothetical protein